MNRKEPDVREEARRVLRIEAEAVAALVDRIDEKFERAVELIYQSRGRVVVTGMGKSGLVGKKIAATLASTGTPAFFLHPAEASHGDLGMVAEQDVVIALSNSGETGELVSLIPFLKRFHVSIIAITGNPTSTLSREAEVNLDVCVGAEACPMGITPTASTTATLAMGDALAVALLIKRGFREEDFASFHPGGSLGKKLFIKIGDLMHAGEELPLVGPETPMHKAVVEISSKRLGMCIVVGSDNKIMGIITDGDIRRGIERWGRGFFDHRAGEVMMAGPQTMQADDLAAKALALMEEKSITSIVVPGEDGIPVGVLHLHDILRAGIV